MLPKDPQEVTTDLINENIYTTNFANNDYEKLTDIFIIFADVYYDRSQTLQSTAQSEVTNADSFNIALNLFVFFQR